MQITPQLIKERLLSNLESVLTHLFPAGKTVGGEFRIGDVHGNPGKKQNNGGSLAVQLRGKARGVWEDFAYPGDPDMKGDIMKLWAMSRGQTFKEAFPEMKVYCGFSHAEPIARKPKPVVPKDGIEKLTPEVKRYLVEERGIPPKTLKRYKIRAHKRPSQFNDHFWLAPFIDSEGEPVMIKSTGIEKKAEGGKDIWTSEPYYTLWGWWLVGDNDREIIITEGEIDAMSLDSIDPGLPVLSLPSGVSNMDWIENDWERLQMMERIWVVTDNDEPNKKSGLRPGEECAKTISKRLGPARVRRVPVPGPFKDVNQAIDSGDETFLNWHEAWQKHAYTFDPPTVGSVEEFRAEAHAKLTRQKLNKSENRFIWPNISFQFSNGKMTVISGYPHGGKSNWSYQTHAHEMYMGEPTFLCSFEIEPEEMIVEIGHIMMGHEPTDEELDRVIDFLIGKLYFFRRKKRDKTTLADLLADMDYVVQRFGVTRIVVDSLHFLAKKEDYEGQDKVSLELTNFAKSRDVSVCLICHSIIKKGEEIIPGMGMVEGSAGITKPIDNGITIWRNIKKAEAILKAEEDGDQAKLEKAYKMHDGVMSWWKNRETGKLPRIKMWFDEGGKSYRLKIDDEIYAPLAEKKALANGQETIF